MIDRFFLMNYDVFNNYSYMFLGIIINSLINLYCLRMGYGVKLINCIMLVESFMIVVYI